MLPQTTVNLEPGRSIGVNRSMTALLLKRVFDVVVAGIGLLLLAPVMGIVAILIKLDSRGPVFFKQERVGRGFTRFYIFKFRTMTPGPAAADAITIGNDPRITRVGRILRATKIDELPQLLNVLIGNMSLVGPRPEVAYFVDRFRSDYETVLSVRPGITDLASLQYRDEAALLGRASSAVDEYTTRVLPDKLRLARLYVQKQSFFFDLSLILRTLVCWVPPLPSGRVFSNDTRTRMLESLYDAVMRVRRPLVVGLHVGLIVVASYLAFWLRFDGEIPPAELALYVRLLPWLVVIRSVAFARFRLFEGLWRYTGIWDLRNIVAGVGLSTSVFYVLVHVIAAQSKYPRTVFVIDSLLLIFLLGGVRLAWRLFPELFLRKREKRVVIFGAGDAGEMVLRDMKKNAVYEYEPIGFVDDDPAKLDRRIHGVRVLGGSDAIASIVSQHQPHEVLVAIPGIDAVKLRSIVRALEPFKVRISTLPSLKDIVNGTVGVRQIRSLQIDDLLARRPIDLDATPLQQLVSDTPVMVTGAGGSIGSELCRQLSVLRPKALILYERYENGLYAIANDLRDRHPALDVHSTIGDVTDARRLAAVIGKYNPTIIFHAAAHKHVPLMELNPCEAIKNNVVGTRMVAEAAHAAGVERMVMISSDKAVNPSSVMGATKRVAELIVRSFGARSGTRFLTVRFGNVLGSNGSVVPRFLEQIKAGGPVTVTHPDMRRYFMLISEAVHLVLHAAAIGEAGGIYVLEMGDQIKLLDMARNLIRLSGFVPEDEIPISFTGLRPGEKLYEELVASDELAGPSPSPAIMQVQPRSLTNGDGLALEIAELERLANLGDSSGVIRQLCRIVPNFTPEKSFDVEASEPLPSRRADDSLSGHQPFDRRLSDHRDRRRIRNGGRRRTDPQAVSSAKKPLFPAAAEA